MFRSADSGRSFDLDRFRSLLARLAGPHGNRLLPPGFLLVSVINLGRQFQELLGVDARIYIRAAAQFRNGLSPWDAFVADPAGRELHFAALPPTVVIFAPMTFIPERLAVWLWIWASLLAAVYIVRKLRLPLWWLLFPPLTEGIFAANPQIVLVALLLSGSPILASLAPILKIHAVAPLVGERRWAALFLMGALLLATFVGVPHLWAQYFSVAGEVSARLARESLGGFSAFTIGPILVAAAMMGLLLLAVADWRAAGWLVAPALLPVSQFHLSVAAMPVLAERESVILAALFALPIRGLPAVVIAVYGASRFYSWVRNRRSSA